MHVSGVLLCACALLILGQPACYSDFDRRRSTTPGEEVRGQTSEERSIKPTAKSTARTTGSSSAPEKKGKKPEQTYKQAWYLICNAEQLSGVPPSAGRKEREAAVTGWIVSKLKNEKARYWFIGLGNIKKEQRLEHFRGEAAAVGLSSCPVEGVLFPGEGSGS